MTALENLSRWAADMDADVWIQQTGDRTGWRGRVAWASPGGVTFLGELRRPTLLEVVEGLWSAILAEGGVAA